MSSQTLILPNALKEPLTTKDVESGKTDNSSVGMSCVLISCYIVGSIMSSVLIVLCNKEVFENGFQFPLTMSFIAYCFTWLYFKVLELSGAWKKEKDLPRIENIKVAISSIASISFMNLCLLTNTVAIYQICKYAVIPCTLVFQAMFFKLNTNWKVLFSLVVILAGVGYASDVGFEGGTLSIKGVIFAILAVFSTSVYRIWQETKQKAFEIGPIDFQATNSGWQAGLGCVAAVVFEFFPVEKENTVPDFLREAYKNGFAGQGTVFMWLCGVCLMALAVNFTSFVLIGETGPIAYYVVGHAKTVLTIVIGIVLFPKEETAATVHADIVGCGVAMFAVVAYGHFEYSLKSGSTDLIDKLMGKGKVAPN